MKLLVEFTRIRPLEIISNLCHKYNWKEEQG